MSELLTVLLLFMTQILTLLHALNTLSCLQAGFTDDNTDDSDPDLGDNMLCSLGTST